MAYSPQAHGARCDLCPLAGRSIVPPQLAKKSPRLIIVGEGPGKTEEKTKTPFTGASGRLLDATLRKNGFTNREEIHVTNATLCRGEKDKDNEAAALCCAPRLLGELTGLHGNASSPGSGISTGIRRNGASMVGPPPILTLGKAATWAVLGTKKILYARGFVWRAAEIEPAAIKTATTKAVKNPSKPMLAVTAEWLRLRALIAVTVVFPTVHPSFILKADTWKPLWDADVARCARWVCEGPMTLEDEGPLRVGGLEVLKGLGDVISLDIETDGVKWLECNILCIGVADSTGQAAVIYPWKRSLAKGLSSWLRTRKAVVAHNGRAFDEIVLLQHGVK